VNNAVKHSNCDYIEISLTRDAAADGLIHFKVTDNGTGVDPEAPGRGIGLQIMAYRAKIIDAQFNIDTGLKGTQIHVVLNSSVLEKKENIPV
jgi:signal transduction histidine kinase